MDKDVSLCLAWGASKFKTIKDVMAEQMTVAGTGAGSSTDIYPMFLNEVLGTKFRVITGYLGSQETIIAIERGEVDGRCGWGWSSLMSTKPDWVRDKKINLSAAARAGEESEDRRAAGDRSRQGRRRPADDDADVRAVALNKPFFGPPGMPAERTAVLRKAIAAALNDAELRAEAAKLFGEDLEPTTGEAAQKLFAEIYATPPAVAERLRGILAK